MRQPLFCGIPTSGPSVNGIPTSGPPATAVRSSSCPVPPVGQHLTGWKGLAVPYEGPGKGHFFTIPAEDYASRRCWFAFVAAGRRIRRGRPRAILIHPIQDSYPDE